MTQLWRINLKTDAVAGVDARAFCFENNLLGVGWPVPEDAPTWEQYEELSARIYKKVPVACKTLKQRMKTGDLCWARTVHGEYYLARVDGDWEYRGSAPHRNADVVNVRKCAWVRVGSEASVPGAVAASFGVGKTLQRVASDSALLVSKKRFNERTEGAFTYPVEAQNLDLFALLSYEDCEDLVGLYLQAQFGYSVIPSTCRRDTAGYEFVLVHRETGQEAVVQVKNGAVNLSTTALRSPGRQVFLFTSRGEYLGPRHADVTCLSRGDLLSFAASNRKRLPRRLQDLWDLANPAAS